MQKANWYRNWYWMATMLNNKIEFYSKCVLPYFSACLCYIWVKRIEWKFTKLNCTYKKLFTFVYQHFHSFLIITTPCRVSCKRVRTPIICNPVLIALTPPNYSSGLYLHLHLVICFYDSINIKTIIFSRLRFYSYYYSLVVNEGKIKGITKELQMHFINSC